MITFSKALVLGHTTGRPRHRFVRGDWPVSEFTVAVNDAFKRGESWTEKTTYLDVVFFGAFATAVKELPKGTGLYLEGRLSSNTRTDEKTGQKRFKLQIVADKLRRILKAIRQADMVEQPSETTTA